MTPLTDLIFKTRHQVIVPTIATISDVVSDKYGIPTSGIPSVDASMYNTPLTVYATINEQVIYWERGHYVRIRKISVARKIYKDIQKYLESWVDHLQSGTMNRMAPPTDDLKVLDRYAATLHSLLDVRNETEYHASDIIRLFNPVAEVADMQIKQKSVEPREDLVDFFDTKFVNKQRI